MICAINGHHLPQFPDSTMTRIVTSWTSSDSRYFGVQITLILDCLSRFTCNSTLTYILLIDGCSRSYIHLKQGFVFTLYPGLVSNIL